MSDPKKKLSWGHKIVSGIIFTGLFFLITVLFRGLSLNPNSLTSPLIDKKAKEIDLLWVQGNGGHEGQRLTLQSFHGKPVVLNFWASWCVSCREEAKQLELAWQRFGTDVTVLGVAVQDTLDQSRAFAKEFGKTYPIGLDESGRAGIDYGVTGVPETFFIDKSGIIRDKITGPVSVVDIQNRLGKLL